MIKTAIEAAINDIRQNPWLLDYMFAGLNNDTLSNNKYGQKIVEDAKKWFINTNIPVQMAWNLDPSGGPQSSCFTVELMSSVESESTLGDIDPARIELTDVTSTNPQIAQIQPILGPFTPAYAPSTGIVTIPSALSTLSIFPGQLLVDNVNNKAYTILTVTDQTHFTIGEEFNPNLTNATIMPSNSLYITDIGSLFFKEVYSIGCHAVGEQGHLMYLHSLLMFILLRYKTYFIQNRGLIRTTLSSGEFMTNQNVSGQVIYSRFLNITGYSRSYWPVQTSPQIQGILVFDLKIDTNNQFKTPGNLLLQQQLSGYIMDADSIGTYK
ncbi:MAG: hypothetical protein KGO96_07330 [Elusimicrobia bacterium]|nr:hypothetical protein [Elusimicrobiota bacterium]